MLGIIDWGIGGVSIYKLIKERLGDVSVVYLSDTGATPYGKMSRRELVDRLNLVIKFLKTKGVSHLVIGCNAASTAIEHLDSQGLKIIGMIESGVAASFKQKPKRLGLIGGRRTVLSGVYRNAFREKGMTVEQRIAQPLSALIESGNTASETLEQQCGQILAPIKNCSHILLACTHYPAISEALARSISPKAKLIDPANELVSKVAKWKLSAGSVDQFFTTGNTREMSKAAKNAWGVDLKNVKNNSIS